MPLNGYTEFNLGNVKRIDKQYLGQLFMLKGIRIIFLKNEWLSHLFHILILI